MKKKVLFCLQTMVMGGVEKELVTVLKRMNPESFDVDLLLFYIQDEEVIKTIPGHVKIRNLEVEKSYWFCDGKQYFLTRLARGHFSEAMNIAFNTAKGRGASSAYISLSGLSPLEDEYDCAICYHLHSGVMLRYVAEKVRAKRKIAWIHNDFNTTGYQVERYINALVQYDSVVAVSERLRKEFIEHCPSLKDRTITIHNIVDKEEIERKAKEEPDLFFKNDAKLKIVTVGRYVEQKGFDLAIETCDILTKMGLNLSWYAIGWGPEEEKLRKLVKEKQLEDVFFVVGRKDNPYPYIYGADVYVQPSRHEGYAVTIEEAKALKKIIVCTDFAGADEQIENERNGIIVHSFSPQLIAEAIYNVCTMREVSRRIQAGINNRAAEDGLSSILSVLS